MAKPESIIESLASTTTTTTTIDDSMAKSKKNNTIMVNSLLSNSTTGTSNTKRVKYSPSTTTSLSNSDIENNVASIGTLKQLNNPYASYTSPNPSFISQQFSSTAGPYGSNQTPHQMLGYNETISISSGSVYPNGSFGSNDLNQHQHHHHILNSVNSSNPAGIYAPTSYGSVYMTSYGSQFQNTGPFSHILPSQTVQANGSQLADTSSTNVGTKEASKKSANGNLDCSFLHDSI